MTVFAVMTAGLFPIIHIGRPWMFYWLIRTRTSGYLWPNFKSPLVWDVFAISTYLTVSTTFLFFGLIPDIAAVRDKATGLAEDASTMPRSFGWQGTDSQWRHFSRAYLFLAALATPLVLSVHSVVSLDFAMSIVPGWHATIFAPVLRGRRHLLGHRHGAHDDHPAPAGVPPRAHDHARVPLRQPGQADPADRLDPGLRLRHRVLHRVVQRQHLRADHFYRRRSATSGGPRGP